MHQGSAREGRVHLLEQNQAALRRRPLLTQNNSADRTVSHRRRVFQVSALSTFDGSVPDYHGCDG